MYSIMYMFYFLNENIPGASPVAQTVKKLSAMQETQFRSLVQKDPLEKGMATHSSILAREFHGQRRLAGYNPWYIQIDR